MQITYDGTEYDTHKCLKQLDAILQKQKDPQDSTNKDRTNGKELTMRFSNRQVKKLATFDQLPTNERQNIGKTIIAFVVQWAKNETVDSEK